MPTIRQRGRFDRGRVASQAFEDVDQGIAQSCFRAIFVENCANETKMSL